MALSSNSTNWHCSSTGSTLGCGAAFSGIWDGIPVGEFFLFYIVFCVF